MKPMLVRLERFLIEYNNHISLNKEKYINWFFDIDGLLKCFISGTNSSEWYCYIHRDSEIPNRLMEKLSKKGEILGFYDEPEKEPEVEFGQLNANIQVKQ